MYIEPNTIIYLHYNVPLDNTYKNTLYFSSESSQDSYFHGGGVTLGTFNSQSYQRVVKGRLRIEEKADNLYNCNYMSFKNSSFGNKWFYAFVTSVEYINNIVTEITFEIDVIQTYLFDTSFLDCMVEREHVENDEVGNYTLMENINTSNEWEFISEKFLNLSNMHYRILMSKVVPIVPLMPTIINGVVCGCNVSNEMTAEETINMLQIILQQGDENSILEVVAFPSVKNGRMVFNIPSSLDGGYIPKNKKLFTSQFNKCILTDKQGQQLDIFFERTNSKENISVNMVSCQIPKPMYLCYIENYNGYSDDYATSLSIKNLPVVAYSGDKYSLYRANNGVSDAINSLNTVINTLQSPSIQGITDYIGKTASESGQLETKGNNLIGSIDTANVLLANNKYGFYLINVSQPKEYLQIADQYFDMYGYRIDTVKQPRFDSRPHWNYVKTKDCLVQSNAPVESVRKICSIFDNGITFWKNADEVGNYSLDNRL